MTAILFGSIGTLADTSELQREAYNEAFAEHGLDWYWGQNEYRDLLRSSGGAQRVADFARDQGDDVDADAVHASKSKRLQERLRAGVQPRPGVAETLALARQNGTKVGFITTTSRANVDALLEGLDADAEFDLITAAEDVDDPKPDPRAYALALDRLGEPASDCIAIEDNVGGVQSADAAGLACVAFPNENTAGHDFGDTPTTTELSFGELTS